MNLQRHIPVVLLGILLSGCQSKTKHYDLKGQVLYKGPATNTDDGTRTRTRVTGG